ncbi:B3 domain-containing protein Os01g0234100-like isoform X2 [Actinidia eriantha]|uniref:B3 domain-containing protein Os01g0234100-like isoform X2 n=1 Tax=Actinidia eriantha TaxID=165200 RepID=UPI0025833810|nr:B3 domain-containing protein Os01g0234100-like isoform X2 [Actinidia eriantha]XP_057487876.1 B3 domain-containing protein Os01g0234100-like isoform X2 [Actinidia eriantha]
MTMSSESVNEGLLVASERKQSEGIDLDSSSNHQDRAEEVVKKEQSSEWPSSEQSIKSEKDDLTLAQLSKAAPRSHSPSYTGKRKKKPKEMHDDFCCQLRKGKKTVTKPAGSKSKHGLPMTFCKLHLPRKDMQIVLEDESGEQFELKFIAEKTGLSAGWRKFAAAHKLVEGDVLIFQLVETNKFKVYVVRANDLTEVDGALGLLNLDAHIKQNDAGKDDADNSEIAPNNKKRKCLKSLPLAVIKKKKKMGLPKSVAKSIQSAKQFENDCEEVHSEVPAGPRLSGSAVRFRDVKSFTDFNILVDGLCIDSELPEHIRVKYYALCCSKNTLIHAHLFRGLNSKLVAGIVCETVNIADAIRACKLTTSRDEYLIWEKTLKSFELMGMRVGFLRARLRHLLILAFESDDARDARKYLDAKSGKGRAEDEIRDLEAKLVELKQASEKFGADIESLKSKAERFEHKFQEEIDAPW